MPRARRLLAELGVIVLGVLIALAADRAFLALDQAEEEQAYLEGLAQDLRSDTAQLASAARWADAIHTRAQRILAVVEAGGVVATDHEGVLIDLGLLSYWAPPEYTTDTWDEIISGAGVSEIRDPELRRALTSYYNSTEYWDRGTVRFFQERQLRFEEVAFRSITPAMVLYVYDRFTAATPSYSLAGDVEREPPAPPNRAEVEEAIASFAADPAAQTVMGYAVVDSRQKGDVYRLVLEECSRVLRMVEEYAAGAS